MEGGEEECAQRKDRRQAKAGQDLIKDHQDGHGIEHRQQLDVLHTPFHGKAQRKPRLYPKGGEDMVQRWLVELPVVAVGKDAFLPQQLHISQMPLSAQVFHIVLTGGVRGGGHIEDTQEKGPGQKEKDCLLQRELAAQIPCRRHTGGRPRQEQQAGSQKGGFE